MTKTTQTIQKSAHRPKFSAQKAATNGRPTGPQSSLDALSGFALLRDRRVALACKVKALCLGGAVVAGLVAIAALVATMQHVPGRGLNLLADGAAILSGAFLFGALLLMRLAPRDVVSRVRCERYRIIPLRKRKVVSKPVDVQPTAAKSVIGSGDLLASLGYSPAKETKEPPSYAIIPQRKRSVTQSAK